MNGSFVLVLNLISTWYMVGLIWMVQVVHYNMFDRVGEEQFAQYEEDHNRLITPIVGVPMLIEIVSACVLIVIAPPGFPRWAAWLGVGLVVMIWVSTALLQVPLHSRLMNGFDPQAHRQLVHTNWIRTVLWTARGILLGYFAARS